MKLYEKANGVQTRWSSFENAKAKRGQGGIENNGAKGHAFERLYAGERKTLLGVKGSGLIHRIWMTVNDSSPGILRSLRIEMFWDGASKPAVSVPLGDFFGISLGRRVPFECALFSDPEGRSFVSLLQMPFRKSARITLINDSDKDLPYLFYDINFSLGVEHTAETLYLHSHWRRESPNELGRDFTILPEVPGNGRFLGCNLGVITDPRYDGVWWGEGEVKVWFGREEYPTLCGTGAEDYIGTAWGQGAFLNRLQGCSIADAENGQWAFYRYHIDDPIYFDDGCRVAIQTIGGAAKKQVIALQEANVPLIPISINQDKLGPQIHLMEKGLPLESVQEDGYCCFCRQDDWSATAYFYHECPDGLFPPIPDAAFRGAGLLGDHHAAGNEI